MRGFWLALVFVAFFAAVPHRAAAVTPSAPHAIAAVAVAQDAFADMAQGTSVKDVNVDINLHGNGTAWYRNPLWIAVGVIGLVVLVLIVAMISRGGGTTIVKE